MFQKFSPIRELSHTLDKEEAFASDFFYIQA